MLRVAPCAVVLALVLAPTGHSQQLFAAPLLPWTPQPTAGTDSQTRAVDLQGDGWIDLIRVYPSSTQLAGGMVQALLNGPQGFQPMPAQFLASPTAALGFWSNLL